VTPGKLIGGAAILFVAMFLGGLLAYAGQPSKPMEAIALGITWQTGFAAVTGIAEAATVKPGP